MADDATAACPASSPPVPPLFERVGGMTALINAVDVFYARVLEDPTLAPFFEGVEMSRQRTKQVGFFSFSFFRFSFSGFGSFFFLTPPTSSSPFFFNFFFFSHFVSLIINLI